MVRPRGKMPQSLTVKWFRTTYIVLLFSLLVIGGISFALNAFHKVYYPFGWDDDEGAVWWEAAHVTDLKILYHPIQQYPYFVVPYPPVFHAVTWMVARGMGDFLVAGRLVCVFAAIGIGLLFGLLVWHASPRHVPVLVRASGAFLAALLCFSLDSLNIYIPEMGVDLLALFFSFLGVYLFIRFSEKPTALYASFACFVLALFTKQTMIAAPLACLVAEIVFDKRRAVRHFLFCLCLGGAGLGFLAWATNGEALRHLFLYNASQPFSLIHWVVGIQQNLIGVLPIAAVACLALLPLFHEGGSTRRGGFLDKLRADLRASSYHLSLFVLGLQLLFAVVISLTYGKSGSGVHYFLEWNFICCALTGLLFVRTLSDWTSHPSHASGGAAVFLLVFLAALTGFPDSLHRIDTVYRLRNGERHAQDTLYANDAAVLKIIEQTPGPVLCENMLLVMKANKEIPIEPGIQGFLGKAGIWDESGFVAMITQQKFGVIIMRDLNPDFWTEPVVQAIADHYQITERIGDDSVEESSYTVYRPKDSRQ
jgi:hypothetical protein